MSLQNERESLSTDPVSVTVKTPRLGDGGGMWRVARDSQTLDLNSSYAYVLFARDFASTCRVAVVDGEVVGFVLGYRRPEDPTRLFVWQVAVDADQRGRGLSGRMLDDLVESPQDGQRVAWVETTITDDNTASQRLFASLARRWNVGETIEPLFESEHFPDGHDPEPVHLIGPFMTA